MGDTSKLSHTPCNCTPKWSILLFSVLSQKNKTIERRLFSTNGDKDGTTTQPVRAKLLIDTSMALMSR
eukprot:5584407-Amphidinium_carterae.1